MKHARQKQDDPLNLQSLPLVSPPADGWPAVEAALRQDARRRGMRRAALGGLAAAAAVVLALNLYQQQASLSPGATDGEPRLAAEEAAPAAAAAEPSERKLDELVALSQQLEARLRLLRAEGGSLPASAVVYQVELEDLVVQVDEELSRQPDSIVLWNQRISLLADLELLYQDRLRREYRQYASL